MIRAHLLWTLVAKEFLRLRKNPPAVMLLGVLVSVALLVAVSGPQVLAEKPTELPTCWIVYWRNNRWIEHLKTRVPDDLPMRIVERSQVRRAGDRREYPAGDCAIELGFARDAEDGSRRLRIRYLYSGPDPNILWPYSRWFWSATTEFFGNTPSFVEEVAPIAADLSASPGVGSTTGGISKLNVIALLGTVLIFTVQFFTSCHLLVSFTSQERERGTLLALGLTPASPAELMLAKFVFHLAVTILVCGVIVAFLRVSALGQPVLWSTLVLTALGLMSVGTVVASLSRTQTTAGLLTFCYMLLIGMVFYLATKFSAFTWLQRGMFEIHSFPLIYLGMDPRLDHFAVSRRFSLLLTSGSLALVSLVALWIAAAGYVFFRRGWR